MNSKQSKKMVDWVVGHCRGCKHGYLKKKGTRLFCIDCFGPKGIVDDE